MSQENMTTTEPTTTEPPSAAPPTRVPAGSAAPRGRQLPKWSELKGQLKFAKVPLTPAQLTRSRLDRAADLSDVRRIAKRVTPTGPFGYVDGAANDEEAHRRNRAVFRSVEMRPRVLNDVSDVDLGVDLLGMRSELPFGFAPTGFTRMMHADGERAVVRAAQTYGIPFGLSSMGTTSIEDVAATAPKARKWFQLYLWKDRRDESLALLERARTSGYDTLIVTVDVATGGLRYGDMRNGFTVPPQLTASTVLDASYRPRWWFDYLTTEPLSFATLMADAADITVISSMFDPSLAWEDLRWIREAWDGPLVVKGVQTVDDALRARDAGAEALWLSNHGGRQLDRAPVPLRELPHIRAAVGDDVQLFLDSGITSGGDIIAALALGADFTFVGRAYLYGLMAGGEAGVEKVIQILAKELEVTLQLMGLRSVGELTPESVRLGRGN